MQHIGLFEGIGGFSIAARKMGWKTVAWCEWKEFCQTVLKYHFPEAEGFGDITKTDFTKYANKIDILTGGFPCQPYSLAGKRKGKEDERHLWPEMLRAIREIRPTYVVGENVGGIVSWNGGLVFEEVHTDLEAEGYEVQAFILPACGKDAPHRRERVWFVAYSDSGGNNTAKGSTNGIWEQQDKEQSRDRVSMQINGLSNERATADANSESIQSNIERGREIRGSHREKVWDELATIGDANVTDASKKSSRGQLQQRQREGEFRGCNSFDKQQGWENFPTQSPICGGDDGLRPELDGITFPKWRNESIMAYGNAIVPQVAFEIFKAIESIKSKKESL